MGYRDLPASALLWMQAACRRHALHLHGGEPSGAQVSWQDFLDQVAELTIYLPDEELASIGSSIWDWAPLAQQRWAAHASRAGKAPLALLRLLFGSASALQQVYPLRTEVAPLEGGYLVTIKMADGLLPDALLAPLFAGLVAGALLFDRGWVERREDCGYLLQLPRANLLRPWKRLRHRLGASKGRLLREYAALAQRYQAEAPLALPAPRAPPPVPVQRLESEIERLGQLLRSAQRSQALGSFSRAQAHDFRNLLLAAREEAERLRQAPGDREAEAALQALLDSGMRLTQSLLDFVGEDAEEPERMDLAQTVADACRWVARLLPANVTLETDLPEAGMPLEGVRQQLEQALVNLLVNARDALAAAGGRIQVAGADAGEALLLTVQDTGAGMDEASAQRIFEPLYTTKPEGRGLGLAIVKQVVDRHQGSIEVASAPGEGARFTLRLPKRLPPAARRWQLFSP